jgi:hypothetical protein
MILQVYKRDREESYRQAVPSVKQERHLQPPRSSCANILLDVII